MAEKTLSEKLNALPPEKQSTARALLWALAIVVVLAVVYVLLRFGGVL